MFPTSRSSRTWTWWRSRRRTSHGSSRASSTWATPMPKAMAIFGKMYEDKNVDAVIVATPILALPAHRHGLRGGQGRLRRKADDRLHRRGQVDDPGGAQIQPNRDSGYAAPPRQGSCGSQKDRRERGARKDQLVRRAEARNIYPGFGKTPVQDPPADLDYNMWQGPAPKKPYQPIAPCIISAGSGTIPEARWPTWPLTASTRCCGS